MIYYAAILAAFLFSCGYVCKQASANSYKEFDLTLDCRSFQASAKTKLTVPVDVWSGAIRQVIWITHKSTASTRRVNLYQHRSADPSNHEASVIDAIAWD